MLFDALDYAAYVALALAAWAAFRGGPSAGALVASNVFARLCYFAGIHVTYEILLCLDMIVVAFIISGMVRRGYVLLREAAILALFPVAWRFYWIPEQNVTFVVVSLIVIIQLLLTLPWMTILYGFRKAMKKKTGPKPPRLEMSHG